MTREEWLAALEAAEMTSTEGALTVRELMERTGWSASRVRNHLREGITRGWIRPVRRIAEAIDGTNRLVPAYACLGAKSCP